MRVICYSERQLEAVITEIRQQFQNKKSISITYNNVHKYQTDAQRGYIFGGLIDSIVKFFTDCGYGVTPESVKDDLYAETEQYLPELVVDKTIFGNTKPHMKTLSCMDRRETSLFIDAIFTVLDNNKIFTALELAPDIRNNWVYHITKEDIDELSKIDFPRTDENYLNYVRTLPCLVCGKRGHTNPHHLKDPRLCGMGQKAPDWATIPLCTGVDGGCHHALAHGQGPEALQNALRWIPFDLKDFCALQYNRWRNHK